MSYPNIIQQINSKLPLSGGKLTGEIIRSGIFVTGSTNNGRLVLRGGTDSTSSLLQLVGKESSEMAGWVALTASDGTNTNHLTVQPNGTGTLNGNVIITSAGGTFTGAIECVSNKYSETTSNEDMTLSNYGLNLRNSDIIGVNGLYFNDSANSYEEGINFPDGTDLYSTILATGGKLYFTPKRTFATAGTKQNVVTLIKYYRSGASWYRKYSDGFIEQGGNFSNSARGTTITFPLAFTSTNYQALACINHADNGWTATTTACVRARTTSKMVVQIYYNSSNTTGLNSWYACGY
jgi:hypothetical protein